MLGQGWIPEGYGTAGVIGCVPPGPPAGVSIYTPNPSPRVGDIVQLTAVGRDASGVVIPTTTVTWSSSKQSIATVSSTGVLRVLGSGTVVVTATIDGVAGTLSLTIPPIIPPPD
jgi:uncharacterized protein YjdB